MKAAQGSVEYPIEISVLNEGIDGECLDYAERILDKLSEQSAE
jgi:hypothetical protein